jgi:tetratricopeptide (TPR) repeat protein
MEHKAEQVQQGEPTTPVPPASTLLERLAEWIQQHRSLVLGGVAFLLLVGAGVVYWTLSRQQRTEEAATLLSRVYTYYDSGDYERALYGDTTKVVRGEPVRGLIDIVREYGNTEPGKVAAVYAGSAFLLMGKVQEARPYFEKASTASSPLVLVGAYAGLAACKEEEGRLAEAAQLYERAATIGAPIGMAERYRFFAAYCYELAGNAQKAIQLYRQILQENEFSDFANDAKAGLARLGTTFE